MQWTSICFHNVIKNLIRTSQQQLKITFRFASRAKDALDFPKKSQFPIDSSELIQILKGRKTKHE